jgi:MazG family protein
MRKYSADLLLPAMVASQSEPLQTGEMSRGFTRIRLLGVEGYSTLFLCLFSCSDPRFPHESAAENLPSFWTDQSTNYTSVMPANFSDLIALMKRLRSPEGCPWDREQNYTTLAPMLLEEAYEAFEAAEEARTGSPVDLRDELGDLLFQIVFYSQVATERGDFTIDDVIESIHSKMVRRHPHVFGEAQADTAAEVLRKWETIKAAEKREKKGNNSTSILDGVSAKAPALMEAHQLSTKAARVGFDWEKVEDIFDKLEEEIEELRAAIRTHQISNDEADHQRVSQELGDLIFAVTNIARHLDVEPEAALKLTNRKFRHRFGHIEEQLRERGQDFESTTLAEMESLWQAAKASR